MRERQARRRGAAYEPKIPTDMRWGQWTKYEAGKALSHLKDTIFPWFRTLGEAGSSFERYMTNAECKINKASLLIEACKLIDQMEISQQNQDVQGDLYEYLLSKLNTAGRNGQFRIPRHIIRMMVKMIDPKPRERIGDLAAGTGGFLVNAYQHVLETHTSPGILEYDDEGLPHHLIGDLLAEAESNFMRSAKFLRGFDNDSGMTMLHIGSMNLILHGIDAPQFFYMDTLSKGFTDEREYDVILMNPPFKGAIDQGDVSPTLPSDTTKTELLFVHLILRALEMGGRCAVIVPDGVLFGSSRAHVALRKRLIEDNRLDGVVSMPSGVFKPYAGVSTAVLLFTRGARAERIWFYDMAGDGFSLDDKRTPSAQDDIPDVLLCWKNRLEAKFLEDRQERVEVLRKELEPLKNGRMELWEAIDGLAYRKVLDENLPEPNPQLGMLMLQDDEYVEDEDDEFGEAEQDEEELLEYSSLEEAQAALAALEAHIQPLQAELDQLTRQFWVTREQVKANKYDLSASRYRQVDADEVYHPAASVVIDRLFELNEVMSHQLMNLL